MSRFLRICAFLFVSLISTNLFAAGYTCPASTKMYTSCDSGYFMFSNDTLADCFLTGKCEWNGTVQANNDCLECAKAPNGAIACPGGTDAPVYQISLNTDDSTTIGTLLYSNSAGFCTGNVSNATECKAGGSTVITKIPELPTKTAYEFKGFYTDQTAGTQVADANGNILVDVATLSGPQTWYAQFTIQPRTRISLDANLYASETATSGTAPSTGVAPRSLFYFKDTGAFVASSPSSTRITKLTTLPVQSNGAKFLGFYTGKAGTGTKTVDASGNILVENIVNAGLYTTDGTATWYAHYQMTCVPLPIYTRVVNGSNYTQRGVIYMKPGQPLVYSNAGCTSQITRLSTAILNSIKNDLSGAQIAGLYLGVEPLTAPSPFNAKYQNPNLIYANRLDTDYLAGTDYARKGYNYPASADDAPEFANPTARARNFMFNSIGALAYPAGHPDLSVLGPDVTTPIYVWAIMSPTSSASTYTTLTQLPDVTGTITGSTGSLSGRFKYVTTCPSGYVQKGEPGTAYSTCSNETFTIAYSGDKQTSGSAPTSPTACAAGDETCVAPANTYTKTGHTFAGWTCTGGNSDCDGDVIQPGDSLGDVASVGGAITLTAKWTPNTYTVDVTNLYGAGYVVYKGTTYNGPDNFSFTCQYGEIITLPEWGENNTLIRDGYIFTGWTINSFTCTRNTRTSPIWIMPRCTAGTGTASTEFLGVVANTAYCSCSSQAGYFCLGELPGEQGVATVTVNAHECPNGRFCPAGSPLPDTCPQGSYSELTSASKTCIACSAGTTTADQGTGPDVGCAVTCPNSNNVSTWATPSWDADNNTVTNVCSVSTCNATSILLDNTCGACTCVAGDNSTCTVKPSDTTNNLCMYAVTCNPGYHGVTNLPGVPGVANNTLPACTANNYTVKFNANGGTGTMADQQFKYNAAQNLTANAFARTGYTFKGWSLTEGSNTVAYDDKQSAQNMTKTDGATVNLYAVWAANCNAITLNPNNGTAGTTAKLYKMTDNGKWYTDAKCTVELQPDDHATLIPTRDGYTFRGFYLASSVADVTATQTGSCASRYITQGGSTTDTGNGWKPSASATLMAGWAKNCAPGTNATCTLTINQCVKYETSCATGYDISNNGAYNPTCSAHPYTITYNLMGGTNNAANPATYTIESATITLKDPTRANSTFAGWYTESSYTNKITQIVKGSTGNKPVYAKWTCNTGYTENSAKTACNPNVTGAIILDSAKYADSTATSGTAATTAATPTPLYIKYNTGVYSNSAATTSVTKITAPVLTGHTFLGFYTGKAGTGKLVVKPDGTFNDTDIDIKTMYSDAGTTATWHAHYEPWTYKIVYNAWKPDTASSTLVGETIEEDATYGVPTTIKTQQEAGFELAGYQLLGWANSETSAIVGAISNSPGQVVSKPNMPQNGYVFNLYPVWSAKRITLNWNESGGDAIDNGSCIYDSTFTLPAAPTRTNYTFRAWQLANQSEQFPTTTHPCTVASFGAIDANNTAHGVKALWNGEKAIVKFKTGNTVLDTKQYEYGTTYTLPDISGMSNVPANLTNASYGWTFVGWSSDYNSTTAEYANKASVTNLTGTITLYPVWKRSVQFTYYKGNTATTTTTDSVDQYYRNTSDTAAGVTSVTTPTAVANTTYGWVAVQWKLNDTSSSVTNTVLAKNVSPAVNTVSPHYYAAYRRSITLSYNGNGSTGGSVDSSTNYQYYNAGGNGSNVAFTAASNGFTKTGHTFQGWTTTATGTAEFQPGDTYTYTNTGWTGSSTATLYAKWYADNHRVTLNNSTATSAVGIKQILYTTYDDGVYLDSVRTKRMTTGSNPIAQLPSRQYTITYSSNGSTSTATAKYNFIGYATSDVSGLTAANTAINSQGYITDVGLAAARNYTDNDHVWAVNWDDAGCVSLRTPADRTGYTFAGWYTSEDFTDSSFVGKANATYCPTRTITLYGKWEPNVYTVTLADSVLDTTHNTIYEKYNTGWYSNAGATTKITSVPKPTRSGIDPHTGKEIDYVFLGYFTTPQEDVNSTHHAPASLQRVDKDGNILPSNTSLTKNTTWYAAWAEPCAKVSHGTCNLKVYSDGSTEYTGECEEGYIPNGYGGAHPTCGGQMVTLVSDFTFHGETLNAMTEAAPKVIYLKPYDGFYTTSTGSTAVTDLTTLPELEHTCFTFNGFYTDQTTTSIKRINADGTFVDNYEFLPSGPEGAFLYAGYTPTGFSITYDLNGGEEVDDGELNLSQTYGICSFKMDDCHANQGSAFKKDGYTLTGWKCYGGGTTACDGSDDDIYAPGAVITHVSNSCAHNPTFVAQWKPIESTITLDKNNVGSTDTNTGNGIIYTKYDWGAYRDSALTDDMSQTLRPITIPTKVFTVKYNANNDGTSPRTTEVAYTFKGYYSNRYGVNQYIDERGYITTAGINEAKATVTPGKWYANWTSKSIDLPKVTRTGYQFNGWYKCDDINQTIITSPFTPTENTELCAKWTPNKYTVTFNANDTNDDASGAMNPQTMIYDEPAALTAEGFTNPGCKFTGWATSADGDVVYTDQQTVSNLTATQNGTVDLYAKWNCMTISASNKTLTYNGTSTTNGTAQSCQVVPNVSNAAASITVTYSTNKNSGFSATAPTLKNVDSGTIYYKVSATGYDDWIDSYTCTMQAKNMTVVANNITLPYTGSAQSCANVKVTDPTDGEKTYSESANGTFSATAPTLTNAGTITIYYQVTGANYNTKTGSYTCTIAPIDNPISLSATSGSTTYPATKSITVSNAQGTVTATSSNTSIATVSVSSDGKTVTMTPVAQGKATITVSAAGNANYLSGSKTYELTVNRGTCTLSVSPNRGEITYPTTTATFTVTKGSCNGALSASSSATGVATVGLSGTTGTVTWKSAGTATITVTAAATNQYNAATAEYKVETKKAANPISLSATSGSTTYPATKSITVSNAQGTVTATSSNTSIATVSVSSDGKTVTMTPVAKGKATITVTAAGNAYYLSGSKTYELTVNPGTCSLSVSPNRGEITYPTTTATFTVTKGSCNGALSASSSATGVATVGLSNTTGTVTWKSAGTATITVTAAATDQYNAATAEYKVETKKGTTAIELSAISGSVAYGATTTFNVTKNPSGGVLSVVSSNSNVATATINGTTVTVTGVGYGTNGSAIITVTSAETSNYLRTSATFVVTVDTGTILLKNTATTAGTTTIYTQYNKGVYNDSARKNAMSTTANGITIPAKAGYVFNGYYSATSGGTQYIDANGKITSNGLTAGKGYKTNGTWHAQWSQASCTVGTGVASATASVTNNIVTCAVTCSAGYSQKGGTNTTATFNKSGSVNVATVATACSPRTFAIEYAGNTNTGGSAPTSPVSCTYDKACTAPDNKYTKTGYTFKGWKCTGGTSACDGDTISAGGSLKNVSTGSKITLTAQWTANEYDVTYSCGDGTGTAPNPATATYDADFTPAANTCSKTGYTFNGWFVSDTTERKAPGVAFKWQYTEDKTLTALWRANEYDVKFNANGGSGTMNNQSFEYAVAQNLTANAFTNAGKEFKGWATSASGSVAYADKANVINLTSTANGTVNLYAVWASCPAGKYCPSDKLTPQDCPANSYCAEGSATPTECAKLGGGLYKNSKAGSTKAENCYITTTGGYYVADADDAAQTQCPIKQYCATETLYWPDASVLNSKTENIGWHDCPATTNRTMTTIPDVYRPYAADGTVLTGTAASIASASIQGYATGLKSIAECRAIYSIQNIAGYLTDESVLYNTTTGKYDKPSGSAYYTRVNAGYWLNTRYGDAYCDNRKETDFQKTIYKKAIVCPAGSYCPGMSSMPKCYGNPYPAEGIGKYSCAADTTHYTLSAEKSTSINACYLTTESKKYVDTAGAGQVTCLAGGACPGGTTVYYNESNKGRTPCDNWKFAGSGAASCSSCPTLTSGWTKVDSTSTGWTSYTQCQQQQKPANCDRGLIVKTATGTSAWGNASVKSDNALSANRNYYVNGTQCSACSGLENGYTASDTGNTGGASACYTTCGAGQYVDSQYSACVNVGVGYYAPGGKVYYGNNSKNTRGQCTAPLTTIGYGYGANEADDCGRILHAGSNTIYLRSAERSSPSLRVKVGDKTFYGALSTSLSGALKIKKDNIQYSVVNDWQ